MNFKEEDLEDIIFDAAQTEQGRIALRERGLNIEGVLFRQVDLRPYGRADLIEQSIDVHWKTPIITIYELKLGEITISALIQAYRYKEAIKTYFNEIDSPEINIVLIGRSIEVSDWVYLLNTLLEENITIYTYSYTLQGIQFKEESNNWYSEGELNQDTIRVFSDTYDEQLDVIEREEARSLENNKIKDSNEEI